MYQLQSTTVEPKPKNKQIDASNKWDWSSFCLFDLQLLSLFLLIPNINNNQKTINTWTTLVNNEQMVLLEWIDTGKTWIKKNEKRKKKSSIP